MFLTIIYPIPFSEGLSLKDSLLLLLIVISSSSGLLTSSNLSLSLFSTSLILISKSNKLYEKQNGQVVSISILKALRHTIYSEIDKLFSFDMSENTEKVFCDICEKYILSHIGSGFKALDFYKSIQKFV